MIVWSVFDRCSRCAWHLIWKKQLYSSAPVQCDQIGRYWKFLATKFLTTFWAILKNSLLCKNCISYFLGNFWKQIELLFTPTSGHTAPFRRCLQCFVCSMFDTLDGKISMKVKMGFKLEISGIGSECSTKEHSLKFDLD